MTELKPKNILYYFLIPLIFIGIILFNSCSRGNQSKVESLASAFLSALQHQNVELMRIYYPDINNVEIFYACDTFVKIGRASCRERVCQYV